MTRRISWLHLGRTGRALTGIEEGPQIGPWHTVRVVAVENVSRDKSKIGKLWGVAPRDVKLYEPSEFQIAYNSLLEKQGKQAADDYAARMANINKWRPSANYGIEP